MSSVDLMPDAGLMSAANDDPEFVIAARFWNTVVRLDIGDSAGLIRVEDGRITEIAELVGVAKRRTDSTVAIAATVEDWAEMLAPIPKPFYQDLWGATYHHDFEIAGDLEQLSQYYPAVSRLLELLRVVVAERRG